MVCSLRPIAVREETSRIFKHIPSELPLMVFSQLPASALGSEYLMMYGLSSTVGLDGSLGEPRQGKVVQVCFICGRVCAGKPNFEANNRRQQIRIVSHGCRDLH